MENNSNFMYVTIRDFNSLEIVNVDLTNMYLNENPLSH